jgi:MFS family permease
VADTETHPGTEPPAAPPPGSAGEAGAGPKLSGLRDFRLLWIGGLLAALGSQMSGLALPLLVLRQTGSAAEAGLVESVAVVSMLATMLPGGALADRFERRRLMQVCDVVTTLLCAALTLCVLTGHTPLVLVLAVVLAGAVLGNLYLPAAPALLRALVPDGQLGRASSRLQARSAAAKLVAPVIGGGLFAWHAAAPFAAETLGLVASATCLTLIRTKSYPNGAPGARAKGAAQAAAKAARAGAQAAAQAHVPVVGSAAVATPAAGELVDAALIDETPAVMAHIADPPTDSAPGSAERVDARAADARAADAAPVTTPTGPAVPTAPAKPRKQRGEGAMTAGLAFLWRQPYLRTVLLVFGIGMNMAFSAMMFAALAAASHGGSSGVDSGTVVSLTAVGSLTGALVAPRVDGRFSAGTLITATCWACAGAVVVMAVDQNILLMGAVCAATMVLAAIASIGFRTSLLLATPQDRVGRVQSAAGFLSSIAQPAGPVVGGALLGAYGARHAFAALAAVFAVCALIVMLSPSVRRGPTPAGAADAAATGPAPSVS